MGTRVRPLFHHQRDATARYLAVLFRDGKEAQRAQHGLLGRGVPEIDVRLYDAEEILSIASACSKNVPPWPRRSPP